MMPLAVILITVSLVDWLALPFRTTGGRSRPLLLNVAFSVLAAALTHALYGAWEPVLLTLLTLLLGGSAWTGLRDEPDRGWLAIAALATMLAVGALVAPVLAAAERPDKPALLRHVATYLNELPWQYGKELTPELVFLTLGLLLFLGPTANAIVKTVMIQIRSFNYAASEEQLKGGRYIGPLERWLIFGLALAGQPTAAALVISAKSIIRFPELQSKAARPPASDSATSPLLQGPQINELTEYFLIGSLLSWSLALLAALPLASG